MTVIKPEGWLLETPENHEYLRSASGILRAREEGRTLEARAMICDSGHNLIVDLESRGKRERSALRTAPSGISR